MFAADAGSIPYATPADRHAIRSFWSRVTRDAVIAIAWLRRVRCGLGGHLMVRHFEPGRISLECVGCGKQTPGWSIR